MIRIGTLNCRGLNQTQKMFLLKDFLYFYRIDVCLLQETHLISLDVLNVLKETLVGYNIFTMLCESKSKGVGFLIRKELPTRSFSFEENRYACLEVLLNDKIINLVNIYVPNIESEQIRFIERLSLLLRPKKNIILGGDFNFVESVSDRKNSLNREKKLSVKRNERSWSEFFKTFGLEEIGLDILRSQDNLMTWTNGHQSSRLDRFYVGSGLEVNAYYSDNILFSMSDHRMVVAEVEVLKKQPREKCKRS